jgi:hypothetical protein
VSPFHPECPSHQDPLVVPSVPLLQTLLVIRQFQAVQLVPVVLLVPLKEKKMVLILEPGFHLLI